MSRTLVPLLVALALIAAACGGGDTGSAEVASLGDDAGMGQENPSSGDDSGEVDVEAALLAFARCMRDEGFDIQDPTVDADGNVHLSPPAGAGEGHASPEELQEVARGACGEHLERVTQTFQHDDETDLQDSMLAFARCMRDQGVDYDDPDPSQPRGGIHQLDRNDPAVRAALEACQPELFGGDHE